MSLCASPGLDGQAFPAIALPGASRLPGPPARRLHYDSALRANRFRPNLTQVDNPFCAIARGLKSPSAVALSRGGDGFSAGNPNGSTNGDTDALPNAAR